MDTADHILQVAATDRIAGESGLPDDLQVLRQRPVYTEKGYIRARRHHIAYLAMPEMKGAVCDLTGALGDRAILFRLRQRDPQFGLGERRLPFSGGTDAQMAQQKARGRVQEPDERV